MSKLSPSSERLSLIPISSVSLNLGIMKYEPTNINPMMKLGWIYLSEKKESKINDNMYINLVIKPSIPSAKCLIDVGNN